jgi:uncharacterized protein (TIGR03083 family)
MNPWPLIQKQREDLADLLSTLTPEQWATPSLCKGWRVQDTAAHIVVAAETSPGKFMLGLLKSGGRFNAMVGRDVDRVAPVGAAELVRRLRAAAPMTAHPPGPATAMLGEAVVHGEDIRRALSVDYAYPAEAVREVADFSKNVGFPFGAKKRVAGLSLRATDMDWNHGAGPEVSGPALSLVLAMTGRRAGLDDLKGDGVETLASRMN